MSNEPLLSSILPFAGSGLGYAIGFTIKKILKWILIIIGFLAGMFFVGVQLLQKYGYVNTVNWDMVAISIPLGRQAILWFLWIPCYGTLLSTLTAFPGSEGHYSA